MKNFSEMQNTLVSILRLQEIKLRVSDLPLRKIELWSSLLLTIASLTMAAEEVIGGHYKTSLQLGDLSVEFYLCRAPNSGRILCTMSISFGETTESL